MWIIPLLLTALWALAPLPKWLVMIAIALSMLSVLKTVVLLDYMRRAPVKLAVSSVMAWYLAWPGLAARDFFAGARQSAGQVLLVEWLAALATGLLGAVCLVLLVPSLAAWNRLAAGWLAMFGFLTLFHFGAFHLLALAWRRCGRSVQPIMDRPFLADSVNDFWSHRWNLAFRDFATQFVMRPLARRWSPAMGLWGCFLFSGIVHELAISVPARAGYGLPFGYFLLQAVGVSFERSQLGVRLGLRRGLRGWLFAFLIIGPPALFLFHPPFLSTVILPLAGVLEPTS